MVETGKRKVLVVDDQDDLREMMAEYLESQGFDVLTAANGLECLLHVKRARPGAIVLDLRMPRLGGIDALKRIRAFDPAITVVIVTGAKDTELHDRALSMGAVAVLAKPFALPELLQAIGGVEGGGRPPREAAAAPRVGAARAPAAGSAGRILVVDDEEEIRSMLVDFLADQGYTARSAVDGATGVEAARGEAPDVVLLDVDMPGLAGIAALSAIRAAAPDAKVIMVSGISSLELAKDTLEHGAFDFVVKPIDFGYLTHSLATAMTMKRVEM